MKVALFTDTYLPTVDGVVTSLIATRRQLETLGHDVLVFAPGPGKNGESREEGVIYLRARAFRSYPGYYMAMFPSREVDLVKQHGVDIIHGHGLMFMGVKGLWASWQAKIPMVQSVHTMVEDALAYYSPISLNPHLLRRGLRLYLRVFLQKCKNVIVPTKAVMAEIRALAPRARISGVVPTGIDLSRFNPELDGSGVREKWGLDAHDVVLHVGRVAAEKNLKLILDAFPSVMKERSGAKLLVVGRGPYLQHIYRLSRRRGLAKDVLFAGFVSDFELPKYYAACDAFAIASKFETQAIVVLEAMACGKPVAGANFRAIPEFVHDDQNGYLFDPDDKAECAEAIVGCLENAQNLRYGARATAEKYSIEKCTRQLVSVYKNVIDAHAAKA
jgi:1,2-diacylglycerol 3-alpha-glucosyltransferase